MRPHFEGVEGGGGGLRMATHTESGRQHFVEQSAFACRVFHTFATGRPRLSANFTDTGGGGLEAHKKSLCT